MKFGIARAITIDAITYLIVGILFSHLVIQDMVTSSSSGAGWLCEIKTGFKLVANNKDLRISTIAIGVSRFFVNSFYSIGVPVLVIEVFRGTEVMLGSVQTMLMCGALVSPIIVLILRKETSVLKSLLLSRTGKLVPFSLLLLLALPEVQNVFKENLTYLVFFLGGICFLGTLFNSAGFVFLNTYFQRRVRKDQLGRFSSVRFMIYSITEPLGMNFFGFLYNQHSIALPIVLLFVGVLIEVILFNIVNREYGLKVIDSVCMDIS